MMGKWVFNDICACLSAGVERSLRDKVVEKVSTCWDYDLDQFTVKIGESFVMNISNLSQEAIEGINSNYIVLIALLKYRHFIYSKFFKPENRRIKI